jgi:hypothetical protein
MDPLERIKELESELNKIKGMLCMIGQIEAHKTKLEYPDAEAFYWKCKGEQ